MPLVPMRLLLDHAAENDYGLAAFNVNNMEQIQSIMEAARATKSPVIVQASRGAIAYAAAQGRLIMPGLRLIASLLAATGRHCGPGHRAGKRKTMGIAPPPVN